jgi:hypothetical protein
MPVAATGSGGNTYWKAAWFDNSTPHFGHPQKPESAWVQSEFALSYWRIV